jgi:hypothetical protein
MGRAGLMFVSAGKVFDRCGKCGKIVQLNKPLLGGLHVCTSECEQAGRHLGPVRTETRGLIRKKQWRVCDTCHHERPQS